MITYVKQHLDEIRELCARFRVKRLELFGSAARVASPGTSTHDLDFLVEFLPLHPGEHADYYFDLRESLNELFECPVDLLMVKAIKNPYFLEAINKNREGLYAD